MLDTHDGIGVTDVGPVRKNNDVLPGLLTSGEIADVVETIHQRSNGESRQASAAQANNLDVSQINCTFYDALGRRDEEYLIARALQFFSPGVPQVYFVGLLAGANDMDLLHRTNEGREINRHYYSRAEIESDLTRPVVRSLMDLIRFRSTHPAFAGEFHLLDTGDYEISIEWRNGDSRAILAVNLKTMSGTISHSVNGGEKRFALVTAATSEVI